MWFFRSPNVVFGEDSLSYLNGLQHKRILVITDRNIVQAGLATILKSQLPEDAESLILGDIPEEPTLDDIKDRLRMASDFSPDLIIGLGGGSSMDAAKALFALYERPDLDIYDITPLVDLNLRKKSRLILIPTTSGTGSECTWAAVLSDAEHKRKNELASPEIIADYAILDPVLVEKLPAGITRNTAVDAITHAIEGHSSQWKNHYSDIFAEKALELIVNNLPDVLRNPEDKKARENVHIGASMAGIAFSNSQIGLAHAMGHSLGAHFRVPHGMTVGLFLPGVVKFSEPNAHESYSKLNRIFPARFRKKHLSGTLKAFFNEIGQPLSIGECNIEPGDYVSKMDSLVSLAEESTGIVTNAREPDSAQVRALFTQVMK